MITPKTRTELATSQHLRANYATIRGLRRAIEALEVDSTLEYRGAGRFRGVEPAVIPVLHKFQRTIARIDRKELSATKYRRAINTLESFIGESPTALLKKAFLK